MLADVFFPDTVGGAGRVAYHLSRELAKQDHEVHVLTRNPDGNLPSHQKMEANLFAHRFRIPNREGLRFFVSEIKNTYREAVRVGRKTAFDLVCAHQSLVASGPFLSSAIRTTPFVYCFYSPWHEEYLVKKRHMKGEAPRSAKSIAFFMKQLEKRILFKAMKVFVLSDYSSRQISAIHQLPPERVMMIPGGIDLIRFRLPDGGKTTIKKGLDFPLDKTVFLTVRNLVPRMGIENLIEAFNRSDLLTERGLLLIGGEGFLKESLQAMVEECNLGASIRFLGRVSEERLQQLYQAADFFVLPTRELEGFGLVILEAMASGTPVLGTPVGAIPETIGLFDRNLLFAGTHPEDLRTKLEDVVQHPEKYRFDAESCRRFVEERYSWKRMAAAFEEQTIRLVEQKSMKA
jgi:glycosyltransferase involved in cell wall biosynthesis